MIKIATFFDENHLNYLYMSNFAIFWTWSINGSWKLSGKNQGHCFTKLSGHPEFFLQFCCQPIFSMSVDEVGQSGNSIWICRRWRTKSALGISWQCQGMSADSRHSWSIHMTDCRCRPVGPNCPIQENWAVWPIWSSAQFSHNNQHGQSTNWDQRLPQYPPPTNHQDNWPTNVLIVHI